MSLFFVLFDDGDPGHAPHLESEHDDGGGVFLDQMTVTAFGGGVYESHLTCLRSLTANGIWIDACCILASFPSFLPFELALSMVITAAAMNLARHLIHPCRAQSHHRL